jgi:uncharacterized OB-fold protein
MDQPENHPDKPRPTPTPTSQPFWAALGEHRLEIQRCAHCGAWVHYPRRRCPVCLSAELGWHEVDGAARITSFTVTHTPTAPVFADEVPQLLGVVELDQGPRLTTTFVGITPEELRVGLRVRPVFDDLTNEVTLLRFEPAEDDSRNGESG